MNSTLLSNFNCYMHNACTAPARSASLPWWLAPLFLPTVSLAPAVLQSKSKPDIARFFEAPDPAARAGKVASMEAAAAPAALKVHTRT